MDALRLVGKIETSSVDGPGIRAVIHTAGCSIGCPGCFNPHTHDAGVGWSAEVRALARESVAASVAAGGDGSVTVSGGEPSDQLPALLAYLTALREHGCPSVVMYSGRTRGALLRRALWREIEAAGLVDVLIDGPYREALPEAEVVKGSENQVVHALTGVIPVSAMRRVAEVEIEFGSDGFSVLGFPSAGLLSALG